MFFSHPLFSSGNNLLEVIFLQFSRKVICNLFILYNRFWFAILIYLNIEMFFKCWIFSYLNQWWNVLIYCIWFDFLYIESNEWNVSIAFECHPNGIVILSFYIVTTTYVLHVERWCATKISHLSVHPSCHFAMLNSNRHTA